jgi:hypothetical protein
MSSHARLLLLTLLTLSLSTLVACGGRQGGRIPGTRVADDAFNREVIEVIERYRMAVEARDAEALVLMASPNYVETRGTADSSDDYGFEGLRNALLGRFQLVRDVRYSVRYDRVRRVCPGAHLEPGCRAHVEVQIDASFTVSDARGEPLRKDKRDQNELVLEWTGDKWLFLSGM